MSRCWDRKSSRVYMSLHICFNEDRFPFSDSISHSAHSTWAFVPLLLPLLVSEVFFQHLLSSFFDIFYSSSSLVGISSSTSGIFSSDDFSSSSSFPAYDCHLMKMAHVHHLFVLATQFDIPCHSSPESASIFC